MVSYNANDNAAKVADYSTSVYSLDANGITATKNTVADYWTSNTLGEVKSIIDEIQKKPNVDPEVKSTLEVCGNKLRAIFYKDGFKTSTKELIPDIKDIIVHGTVVIVEFVDGTSEKAVTHPEDIFSLEQGISICIAKKLTGGSAIYNKLMERALNIKKRNEEAKAKKAAEEKERKERAKKYAAKKAARKAQKKEDYINTHAEAVFRAMMRLSEMAKDVVSKDAD